MWFNATRENQLEVKSSEMAHLLNGIEEFMLWTFVNRLDAESPNVLVQHLKESGRPTMTLPKAFSRTAAYSVSSPKQTSRAHFTYLPQTRDQCSLISRFPLRSISVVGFRVTIAQVEKVWGRVVLLLHKAVSLTLFMTMVRSRSAFVQSVAETTILQA